MLSLMGPSVSHGNVSHVVMEMCQLCTAPFFWVDAAMHALNLGLSLQYFSHSWTYPSHVEYTPCRRGVGNWSRRSAMTGPHNCFALKLFLTLHFAPLASPKGCPHSSPCLSKPLHHASSKNIWHPRTFPGKTQCLLSFTT